jgi:hypothetical protein
MQDLGLLLVKNHLHIQFVDSTWLKHLAMHIIMQLCSRVVFLSRKWFSQEVLPDLVEKTKQKYVLPKLKKCHSTIASFDIRMSKGAHDVFALVINFWVWIGSLNISQ